MPLVLREVLADHHFHLCLERGPLRELWQVRAPDGRLRVAQLLSGVQTGGNDQWLERLLQVVDPALPSLDAIQVSAGQTILLTDLWTATLQERFQECRAQGLAGVPRQELLGYLRQIAQALDFLQRQFRLQHLNLHPGNLLLNEQRVQVEGFGLAQLLWLPARVPLTHLHADYAARELRGGCVSAYCDQYSLALIFAEMLTGVHPVRGSNGRRSCVARQQGALQLEYLSEADRPILGRALDPHPQRRFPNLPAAPAALAETLPTRWELPYLAPLIVFSGDADTALPVPLDSADQPLGHRLWVRAGGDIDLREFEQLRFRLKPGERLEHRYAARLYSGAALLKLDAFRQRWRGQVLHLGPTEFRLALPVGRRGNSGWFGRTPGLELQVQLIQLSAATPLQHVTLTLTPFGCRPALATCLLAEWGPRILLSVREYLRAEPEQRAQERLRWDQPLRIHPVGAGQRLSTAIEGVGKDISPSGLGLFVPQLPGVEVYVQWPAQQDVAQLAALAHVVRGRECGDGWFEVGVVFKT